jgi:hypothetical protein
MENNQVELVKKIVGVIKSVGVVEKTGKNEFHKYNYRKHEDIVAALQPALIENGIIIIAEEKTIIQQQPGYVLMKTKFRVTDGAQFLMIEGIGEGVDMSSSGKPGDKAAYKAQTGAAKYALNDLLWMASDMDPEKDHEQEQRPTPKTQTHQTTETNSKISDAGLKQMVEMMLEMNWPEQRKKLAIQKAEIVGEKVALDGISKEYNKFLDTLAAAGEGQVKL